MSYSWQDLAAACLVIGAAAYLVRRLWPGAAGRDTERNDSESAHPAAASEIPCAFSCPQARRCRVCGDRLP